MKVFVVIEDFDSGPGYASYNICDSALLCFVLPFISYYLVSRFMNSIDESIEPPEQKREPIDPDDPMCWNFSEARLRGMN